MNRVPTGARAVHPPQAAESEEHQVVLWAEDGRLLLAGEPTAVDTFLDTFEPARRLDVGSIRGVADGLAVLSAAQGIRTTGARYVQLSKDSLAKLDSYGPQHDGAGWLYGFVRDSSGRFAGNLKGTPVKLAGSRALSVQLAMATAALALAMQETNEAVEKIAADVDELRQLAEAAEIGNVAGLYRVLANARTQVDETASIGQATWDAIAVNEVPPSAAHCGTCHWTATLASAPARRSDWSVSKPWPAHFGCCCSQSSVVCCTGH